jgi:hypothetical protein
MRRLICAILTSMLILEPLISARAAEEPGAQAQESRKSQLMQKLLMIPPHTYVEVRLLGKKKLRGRLGKVADEGFVLHVVQADKIQEVAIRFDDVKSVRILEKKRTSAGKVVAYGLAGIGAFFVGLLIACVATGCGG